MRAVVPKHDGSARVVDDYAQPSVPENNTMIQIIAGTLLLCIAQPAHPHAPATVNPLDFKVAKGSVPIHVDVLGFDFAGVVVNDAGPWKAGDRVVGYAPSGGAFAEYIAVPALSLVRAPSTGSSEQAAALGVAGLTAYQVGCVRGCYLHNVWVPRCATHWRVCRPLNAPTLTACVP